jgi:hypothetical protein
MSAVAEKDLQDGTCVLKVGKTHLMLGRDRQNLLRRIMDRIFDNKFTNSPGGEVLDSSPALKGTWRVKGG